MKIASVTVAATAQILKNLLPSWAPDEVSELILQAPTANTGNVFWGTSGGQYFEVIKGGVPFVYQPGQVPGGRLKLSDVYIKGTASDKLSVGWIPYGEAD